jgi:hypothetical protein
VVDAIGVIDNGATDRQYGADLGGFDLPYPGYVPDALYRVFDASGAPCNWNGGDVSGASPGGPYLFEKLANFGFGEHGLCAPPLDLGCANLLPDDDQDGNADACDPDFDYVGSIYCSGDGSSTDCPCGNAGGLCAGCRNGSFADGALLRATGSAELGNDSLVLRSQRATPSQPGLFFQGNNPVNVGEGVAFGDGLRCAGNGVVRLQVVVSNPSGNASSSVAVGATGDVQAGETKYYQFWYRDPQASVCATNFNLSNGLKLVWAP